MHGRPTAHHRTLRVHTARHRDAIRISRRDFRPEAATGPFRGIMLATAFSLPLWAGIAELVHALA